MEKGKRAGESPIGVNVIEGKSYFWCTCGISSKQPLCDGSHKNTNFTPIRYLAEQSKKVFFARVNKLTILPCVMGHIIFNSK